MIFYLALGREAYTLTDYLADRGARWRQTIQVIPYESLSRIGGLPIGTYIFSDLDRLTRAQMMMAIKLYATLAKQRPDLLLLNDPARFTGRFDLLSLLYQEGRNDFNVYRPYELPDEIAYPVFLRFERDHLGARSPLLQNRTELDLAISDAVCNGAWPSNLMVVEFCDTSDGAGVFRKYSVWRFGRHYMARHQLTGHQWVQKHLRAKEGFPFPQAWVAEERRFLDTNPHLKSVREVFELANIEFGRIDYSVKNGRIQVWEINTNPNCITRRSEQMAERMIFDELIVPKFDEAWQLINCALPPAPTIPYQFDHKELFVHPVEKWTLG